MRRGRAIANTAEWRRSRGAKRALASKTCKLFGKRRREAIATSLPAEALQPAFFHQLRLAEDAAARGNCAQAYREIGQAKRFGKRFQRRDDD